MAKDQPKPDRRDEVQDLAAGLFIEHWRPQLGSTPEALAAMCFRGAQQFLKVASRIREGQSPEEIINPPENVTVTPSL